MKDQEYVQRMMAVVDKFYPKLVTLRSNRNEQDFYHQGLVMVLELKRAINVKDRSDDDESAANS